MKLGHVRVVGVLNVTPDSFSDGGRYPTLSAQIEAGCVLAQQGADIIEVGGESTRPGAEPVPLEEELRRVIPVVRELKRRVTVPLSVDTCKAEVARQALSEGVAMINDVTALRGDPAMAGVVAQSTAQVVLMHMRGTPKTMQRNPFYRDVVSEVLQFLKERIDWAVRCGITAERIVVDPGIGFGKRVSDNLQLLRDLSRFTALRCPVMVGLSRKSFLGHITGRPVGERELGGAVLHVFALLNGAAYLRVHNVRGARETIKLVQALTEATEEYDAMALYGSGS